MFLCHSIYQIFHEEHSGEGQADDAQFEPTFQFSEVSPTKC